MLDKITILLCFITLITGFLIHFSRGLYSRKNKNESSSDMWTFNLFQNMFSLCTVLIVFLLLEKLGRFSVYTVLLGAFMGTANTMAVYASLKAYSHGPFSYTTVIVSLSVVIPTLSGLFFDETISIVQYIGILTMIACIVLSAENRKENKSASFKWLFWSMIAFVSSGLIGIFQKILQASSDHRAEHFAFLVSCFVVSVILSFFCLVMGCKKTKEKFDFRKKLNYMQILGGFSNAISHSINIYLVGVLPTVIIFPLVNLIPMIFLLLSAVLIFKEKLSGKQWVGIITGLLATVLLSGILN